MTLPDRAWDNISRAQKARDADISVMFTCTCGWTIHAVIDDISQPVNNYLPPGWRSIPPDTIQCPDCARTKGYLQ